MPLLNARGKLTLLRVNKLNDAFGPNNDQIRAEAIFKLDSVPNRAFGVRLLDDNNRAVGQGMLDLLRDALRKDWVVHTDFEVPAGKNNGLAIRIWVTREQPASGGGFVLDSSTGTVKP